MANRDVTNYRTVGDVEVSNSNAIMGHYAEVGQQIIKTNQEAKITENISAAQMDLSALNNKFQIENEANPMDPKALDKYKQDQNAIVTKYGETINPFFQREWQNQAKELSGRFSFANQNWAFKQTKDNSTLSVNNSILNNVTLANINGQAFGKSPTNDLMAMFNYNESHADLEKFGKANLGETTTAALLKSYKVDYAKSFISGVAESNPQKAAQVLDQPTFKDMFTTEERGEMVDLINKTQKKQELDKSLQQTQSTADVTKLVNEGGVSYFDKRLAIDKMEFAGQISNHTATQARRVLTSQKDVDSVTSTPIMASFVTRMYDLNSIADSSPSDYLNGVQKLHDEILESQKEGQINAIDTTKLNDQMRTLTSSKVADATKRVGVDFYDANQKFQSLPPEYRGTATRELFYQTTGQDLTPADYSIKADKVIDNINKQRREKAMQNVKTSTKAPQLNNDEEYLKTKGYSMQDVQDTADKYHISTEEVIVKLRAKK